MDAACNTQVGKSQPLLASLLQQVSQRSTSVCSFCPCSAQVHCNCRHGGSCFQLEILVRTVRQRLPLMPPMQPEHVATIWNFRGLNCNTWGTVPLRLE